jgi:hypothetical protein
MKQFQYILRQASCRLVRLSAPLEDALLQRPLPDDALRMVALVEKAGLGGSGIVIG